MSDIKFNCLSCGKKLVIDTKAIGMMIRCPGCGTENKVPETSAITQIIPPDDSRALLEGQLKKAVDERNEALAERDRTTRRADELQKSQMDQESRLANLNHELLELRQKLSILQSDLTKAGQQRATLSADVDMYKTQVSNAIKERDSMAHNARITEEVTSKLQAENDKLTSELSRLSSEIKELKSEHDLLIDQQKELKSFASNLAGLRKEVSVLREEERRILKKLDDRQGSSLSPVPPAVMTPSSQPPHEPSVGNLTPPPRVNLMPRRAPPSNTPAWLAPMIVSLLFVFATILAVLWFQPDILSEYFSTPETDRLRSAPPGIQPAALQTYFQPVADAMDVSIVGYRIEPVSIVSVSGIISTSDRPYLIVDVQIQNNHEKQDVYIFRTWRDARMADDQGRALTQAFTDMISIGEVEGMANGVDLTPGETTFDMIVFEIPEMNALSFSLSAEPVFWRRAGEESFTPFSVRPVTARFSRDEIKIKSDE
ncbi:MAG TPA: hypothetical protein PJ991_05015 [Kiritimatiellia bacterium]|nr:hypothetical protein [Kiritimatiellia bacterium]